MPTNFPICGAFNMRENDPRGWREIMSDTVIIRALLDLEDSGFDLLFTKVPGTQAYLWPLARWPIANALASAQLKVVGPAGPSQTFVPFDYLRLVARELLPNPRSVDRLRAEVEHLFIVGGGTHTSAPLGIGNWLSDAFAQALGDQAAVVQEDVLDFHLTRRKSRPANPRTWTKDPVATRVGRAAKGHPLDASQRERVIGFLEAIFSRLGGLLEPSQHDGIIQEVLKRASRVRYDEVEFSSILDRLRPRRIYLEEAAYGHYAGYNRLAHERGIEVAELQHGWIGASHAAYNYGQAWFDSPLTSSLPDTLLTFGEFWSEELRIPARSVPVGKPLLEFSANGARGYLERQPRLLLVSSVYETEKLIAAGVLLKRLLPDFWEVALRPHPSERANTELIFADALSHGVTIDREVDVNVSISCSRAVVGIVSTVLFEALPFNVHIGVIETDLAEFYAGNNIFPERLDDEGSFSKFVNAICSVEAPPGESGRAIWQPKSVEGFLRYSRSV